MRILILAQILTSLAAAPAADPPSASWRSPIAVLRFMAEIPACESEKIAQCLRPGGWDHIGNAREIALAISEIARDQAEADRMSIFTAFEGGMRKTAVGDGGKSKGVVQLQGVADDVALDPRKALRAWQALGDAVACAGDPDERLAALASGSCSRGRRLVRRREELRRTIRARLKARASAEAEAEAEASEERTFVGVE